MINERRALVLQRNAIFCKSFYFNLLWRILCFSFGRFFAHIFSPPSMGKQTFPRSVALFGKLLRDRDFQVASKRFTTKLHSKTVSKKCRKNKACDCIIAL
jgi:hypothetical protein